MKEALKTAMLVSKAGNLFFQARRGRGRVEERAAACLRLVGGLRSNLAGGHTRTGCRRHMRLAPATWLLRRWQLRSGRRLRRSAPHARRCLLRPPAAEL